MQHREEKKKGKKKDNYKVESRKEREHTSDQIWMENIRLIYTLE